MNPDKKTARISGLLYLVMTIFSVFSMMFVDQKLYVPGDAAATISNILASEGLYRIGFVCNLAGQIVFLFLVSALYQLFKPVDKNHARMMVIIVVAGVPIACFNLLSQYAPFFLLKGQGYLSSFQPVQLQALTMVFIDMQRFGLFIAQIFWGLWLFPLSILVIKSGFIPKFIGIFLLIAGTGYLVDSLGKFLLPDYNITISMFTFIGELLLMLWLLIKGVKEQKADNSTALSSL